MGKWEELMSLALKKIQIADHMLTMTYPLVKDPKLLLNIMENTFLALTNSVGALLHYERTYKRVPQFQDTFASKFNIFKQKCTTRYNIDPKYILMMQDIKDIIVHHRKSPMEFTRNDALVICSDDYMMKTISVDKMKSYVLKSKTFVSSISHIISSNKEAFNRSTKNF
ncbi:MAG: hypothetical protein U9O94_03020 [Nanoarchaeota archaeon]|nr:hypothetical protein [Nanoarchaeota archaeon]